MAGLLEVSRRSGPGSFVRWLDDPVVVEAGQPLPIDAGAADTASRARAMIPGTAGWLRIPSYEIREGGNHCLVIVRDLRYTWTAESGFAIAGVELEDSGASR